MTSSRSPAPTAGQRQRWDGEFSQYFTQRAESVRFTAYLLCGDWHHAEDITQAAFLKLYLAWPKLVRRDELDAYTRRVVVRTFLAERRRPWRRERAVERPPDAVTVEHSGTEDRMLLWQALAAVSARQRAVLVLRYWNDLDVAETAAALGCSPGTVKTQCARGLAALRQRLGPQFAEQLGLDLHGR
ncbi:SigE family RNA polymerase sigma factor [Goodfellowiella coeruleoviolacea]|uniref:RNA polymerase sigma-70 factor, sigma-E family n=1 Tax=Goodfellowiella coeruleoviolacea TaxID=334858 RepID=A0AAE3GL91_9PSEU|nr:SigE family RNA polymerase sigma factor [Goodfellowiella coeruleoviolacea]MCP2169469.1 RNA polymerase sigma-70 factor, sigma-E family [Goodfellowiella coeruleoviolacea]